MNQTVGFQPSLPVREVPEPSWRELVQWIHYHMGNSEIDGLMWELQRRLAENPQAPRPIEVYENQTRVAGAYMLLTPGNVASLSGIRATPSHVMAGIQLVKLLTGQAIQSGAQQIQAIIDSDSDDVSEILLAAGFRKLALLKHLWLQLSDKAVNSLCSTSSSARFVPANQFARKRIENLIARTFDGTLDCPALNGLRKPASILESFLEGRRSRNRLPWWMVQDRGEEVGCLLLREHPQSVVELVYMGLTPDARGRGLGASLLQTACEKSLALGSHLLVAAVDCENWPAVRLYEQSGFHEHRRLQAWFRV